MSEWYSLRVFSAKGEGGNPLAVVPFSAGVRPGEMAAIARAIGVSETVFLGERPQSRHTAQPVKIFTPWREVAFAGHPLVGTAWLAEEMEPGRPVERLAAPSGEIEAWRIGPTAWIRTSPPAVNPAPTDVFSLLKKQEKEPK